MRSTLIILAALLSTSAFAEAPLTPSTSIAKQLKPGVMLHDAHDARLGAVNRVNADGSVGIIMDSKWVTIPADTLSVVDGKAATRLTKKEILDTL